MRTLFGITLPTQNTQKGLEALRKMGLLAKGFEVKRNKGSIQIPLIHEPSLAETDTLKMKIGDFGVEQADFQPTPSHPKKFHDVLQIPTELASKVPRRIRPDW